jgi:hypothetical protein
MRLNVFYPPPSSGDTHITSTQIRPSRQYFLDFNFVSFHYLPLPLFPDYLLTTPSPHRQLETQQYKPALILIDTLLTELKRLDDKMILTEVHLLESRVYRGIGNLAKAKVPFSLFPASPHSVRY